MIDLRFGVPGGMRTLRPRLVPVLAALVLVVAGCGPTAAPSPSATPVAATPTAEPSPSATATAEPSDSPLPTRAAGESCQSSPPTDASSGWTELEGEAGDYRFSYPSDWQSAGQSIPSSSSVSPDTFAETGLASDASHHVDLVRAPDGSVGVSAWVIEDVTTPTEELFTRELAWLSDQPQLSTVLADDLVECFDGTVAPGFSSTWDFPTGAMSIVIFMAQRNGKMYQVQLTTNDQSQELTFMELIRTWEWLEPDTTPPGGGGDIDDQLAATDFKIAGMAPVLVDEEGQEHPDESSFEDRFPARSDRIYVVYELDDDVVDTVEFTWRRGSQELFSNSFDYTDRTTFAWAWITPPSSGEFQTGDYSVTMTLSESGDSVTLPFTVE